MKYFGDNVPRVLLSYLKKFKIQVALINPFSEKNIYSGNEAPTVSDNKSRPVLLKDLVRRNLAATVSDNVDHPVLQPLQDMVRTNLLPALRNVFIFTKTQTPSADVVAADKYFFSKNNICLHISQNPGKVLGE